ncbi:MAG: hypothetical protein KDE27_22085 [Planctomycetes bacterium]|nr:hypothetical protein [Planctomycetota bacterium]
MAEPTPSRKPARRGRKLLFGVIALAVGLVGALVVAEIALRIWDPLRLPHEDTRGFYRLDGEGRIETTPGWTNTQYVDGAAIAVHMNALGLRGPELGPEQPGERRVLMLGDSFVFGLGVADDATIPARLEQQLRAAGEKVAIGNAGMFGTGPREWSYTLERHRPAFHPDAVVAVMYVGNDVQDSLMDPLSVVDGWLMISGSGELQKSWRFRLRLWSRLWNYVERLFSKAKIEELVLETVVRNTKNYQNREGKHYHLGEAVYLDRDPARDAEEPLIGRTEAVLDGFFAQFAAACKGLPAIVVLLPAHEVALRDYGEILAGFGFDPALYERGRGHQRIRRLLAAHGLEVVDLTDRILAEPDRRSLYLKQDWHFSAKGCRRVADWLRPEIERLLAQVK